MVESKIKSVCELAEITRVAKQGGSKIALAFGAFDLLHVGHTRHLEYSKSIADSLVVGVIPDVLVSKGPGRPVFGQMERMEQVASLACVDYVCLSDAADPAGLIERLQPDFFTSGRDDWDTDLSWIEQNNLEAMGVEVIYNDLPMHSSTHLINNHLDFLSDRVRSYLDGLKRSYTIQNIKDAIESLAELRVLIVGDLIVDEYTYCRVSGTVSKWPVIAAVHQDTRQMSGGGAAIARHVKQFAREVHYVSTIGDQDKNFQFVARLLESEGIGYRFFDWPGTFTVTKRRFITGGYPNPLAQMLQIDNASTNIRLFEIVFMPQSPLPTGLEDDLCSYLMRVAPDYDLVIIADFGHGLVSPRVGETLAAWARWWVVNAQTNSSNYGFNRVTKYHGPDFICIDELEARLPSGNNTLALEKIVMGLRKQTTCDNIMVTRGSDGLLFFNDESVYQAPALATRVVDTLGAGDAVLSLASLCCAKQIDGEFTALLSACMGALASSIIGNDEPVCKSRLLSYIEGMLK